jgi:hypothetical protein
MLLEYASRRLEMYAEFAEWAESGFAQELEEIEVRWKATLRSESEEIIDELVDVFVDEADVWRTDYPEIIRESLFVRILAEVEALLDRASVSLGERHELPIEPRDLRDRGIRRSWKYLTMVCGLDLSSAKDAYEILLLEGEVRNAVVHRRSVVQRDHAGKLGPLVAYGVTVAEWGGLSLDETAVPKLVVLGEKLVKSVRSAIRSAP